MVACVEKVSFNLVNMGVKLNTADLRDISD